ncbi:glycosyltransferase [Amycolatopsis solani]|uniref:glycosyltransferase n=1 Tax=Amycolatopsis solani TaxID=3028615 RepID=UPI00296E5B95|nr:glycosyltransferase [Amycolatopsis sp. MEP2-6]
MVRLSVLMPCLDAGHHLAPALDSVLGQLGRDDELVVQDARSADGSAELLDRLAAGDPRLRVVHERDEGQSDALNRALDRARGDFILWANADDLLLPGALDAVRAAVEPRTEVAVGGWQLVDGDGGLLRESPAERLDRGQLLLRGCYAFSGALAVDRQFLHSRGGFAADLHYVMDFDLMLRLADADQVVVPAPLAALRYHDASKSGGLGRRFFTEGARVRWRGCRTAPDAVRALAGTAWHAAGVATAKLRFGARYTSLRQKVVSRCSTS